MYEFINEFLQFSEENWKKKTSIKIISKKVNVVKPTWNLMDAMMVTMDTQLTYQNCDSE